MARMFTIVVAAGTSQRYGTNKLAEVLKGETILERSVTTAISVSDGVVVVTDPEKYSCPYAYAVVAGGATRSQSVKNGLAAVPQDVDIIAIHDAARPGATVELYHQGKQLVVDGADGAVPAIKVIDTIKTVDTDNEDLIASTVDRSTLRAVQTPQVFKASVIRQAHEGDSDDTDDSALVEKLGYKVTLFEGLQENRKVTTPEDLAILRALMMPTPVSNMGTGYDIHPFSKDENKKLILGGVTIDHVGLEGHSDSDAVSHALTDALLSAIGAPDLGTLFPASKTENENRSSQEFLEEAVLRVEQEKLQISNAIIIINAEKPKLASHLENMKDALRKVLGNIASENTIISITPKHGEGIGPIGAGEAIAVYATVLLSPKSN